MGKTNELPVVNSVLTKSSDGNTHAMLEIHILCYLRTIILFQILDELLRCDWKGKLLRDSLKLSQCFYQFFLGCFLSEFNKYSSSMR